MGSCREASSQMVMRRVALAPQSQEQKETEGQGQPVLPTLVVREADEDEFGDWGSGVVAV